MDIDDLEDIDDLTVPDFSGDDFADDKQIQKKRILEAEFKKMTEDSIKVITDAFCAQISSHKNLKHFLLHKTIAIPTLIESYQGKWGNKAIHFCVFQYTSSVYAGKLYNAGENNYFVGLIDLDKTYPHTIVQPETIALKIEDLFTKTDVDFAHAKRFSWKFHAITEDKTALEMLFFNKDLDRIAQFPLTEFELNNRQCYFRENRKPVSLREAENFVELAKILLEVL